MKLACKLCDCDLVVDRGRGKQGIADHAWRATVLLTTGNTTDVTVCDCCLPELQSPSGLTTLRRRANELLRDELAAKLEHDRVRTGAAVAPALEPAVAATAIAMTRAGYLHVFGARRWKEVQRA